MEKPITTVEYFRRPETNRPAELVYGFVREPPAPAYGHQRAVGRLFQMLNAHVQERQCGEVVLSPMDVVLDEEAGLIVQPDLMFISNERASIIQTHILGAPDLVVEVAASTTEYRDRTVKLAWYKQYGVRECWFVYPAARRIDVVDCGGPGEKSFNGRNIVESRVLRDFAASVEMCLA